MKITICSLLLLAQAAFADNKVQLARLGPAEPAPTLARNSGCAVNEHVAWNEVKLDERRVLGVRECDAHQRHAVLVFEAKPADGTVHLYTSALIAGDKVSLWNEQLAIGKLKGGKQALLHRVDTKIDTTTQTHVDVCTFDKDGTPMCGSASAECPETGCQEPQLIKGALWIHTKDGRRRYTIE